MTSSSNAAPLLEVEDLCVELPTENGYVQILDHVSFTLAEGEFTGLAGESGSGKTMTALSIMRLLPSTRPRWSGQIRFKGRDLLSLSQRQLRDIRGDEISMVFQEPMSSLHPAWSVGEQIAESVRAHNNISRDLAWKRALEMLDRVGIPDPPVRAKQYSFQFSGGMQQRAMMAMALANDPKLLIADEPTTALDVTVQAQIAELIKGLQTEFGMAVLFVTHDLGLLAGLAEQMIIMYGGQIIEQAPTGELFRKPLHPYTEALVLAAPHPGLKGTRLTSIPGAPPRPGMTPAGCRFHPRCTYATAECKVGEVPLESVVGGRAVRCVRHSALQLSTSIEEVTS